MPRTRRGPVAGGGGHGTASRKSQIIEEEEDEILVDESFEEYEEIEEVDDFSPIDEKSLGVEGVAPCDGKTIRTVVEEGANADAATESAQSKDQAPETQSHDLPLGSTDISEAEYPPFTRSERSDDDPELVHPPRSSSLTETKPGSPRSIVTADPRASTA
jgi:hypothetical protein